MFGGRRVGRRVAAAATRESRSNRDGTDGVMEAIGVRGAARPGDPDGIGTGSLLKLQRRAGSLSGDEQVLFPDQGGNQLVGIVKPPSGERGVELFRQVVRFQTIQ